MLKTIVSFFLAGYLSLGINTAVKAEIIGEKSKAEENNLEPQLGNLETKLDEKNIDHLFPNSLLVPSEKSSKNNKDKKKAKKYYSSNPLPRKFEQDYNFYKYNFKHFDWFYPFVTTGMFPQQYAAVGTLLDLTQVASLPDFFSGMMRLQALGESDYLKTGEFSYLATPQAELTLATSLSDARSNTLNYYLRDTRLASLRKKIWEISRFYRNTPGLLLRFRAENKFGSEVETSTSYHAQATVSYDGWFMGGRYLLQNNLTGGVFLFGREDFYAAFIGLPATKSTSCTVMGKFGMFHLSLQGELNKSGWEVKVNLLGSSIEADLFGK